MGTVHEDQYTFLSDKSCREDQNTHFIFNNFFSLFLEKRVVYEIMWENIVESGRLRVAMWRMCIACRIPKVSNNHRLYIYIKLSGYVTFIAFSMIAGSCVIVSFVRTFDLLHSDTDLQHRTA
jgi:hypothetical protein